MSNDREKAIADAFAKAVFSINPEHAYIIRNLGAVIISTEGWRDYPSTALNALKCLESISKKAVDMLVATLGDLPVATRVREELDKIRRHQ